jgi:hypothetical protein
MIQREDNNQFKKENIWNEDRLPSFAQKENKKDATFPVKKNLYTDELRMLTNPFCQTPVFAQEQKVERM